MVSNYDLRLGRETLEVLDRLMAQIEQFPADLEKLDLSIVNARYKYIVELKETLDEISADITAKKAAFDERGDKFSADYAKFKDDKAVADAAFIKNGELHIDTERLHGLVNVMYIKILDYLERTLKARNEAEAFALEAKLSEFDREKVEAAVREFEDLKAEVEQKINEYAAQMDSRYEQWDSKWAEFDGLADLIAELKRTIGASIINDEIISKQSVYSSQKTALLINTQSELIAAQNVSLEGKITEAKSEANAAVLAAKGELTTAINTAKSEAIADAANKVNEAKGELNAAIEALKGEASTDATNKINEAKTEIELNINTAKLEAIGSANTAINAAKGELQGSINSVNQAVARVKPSFYREFHTSVADWVPPFDGEFELIIVGGGGGGGGSKYQGDCGGGGGGGGACIVTKKTLSTAEHYSIVIGAGGNGGNSLWSNTDYSIEFPANGGLRAWGKAGGVNGSCLVNSLTDGANGGNTVAFGITAGGGKGGLKGVDMTYNKNMGGAAGGIGAGKGGSGARAYNGTDNTGDPMGKACVKGGEPNGASIFHPSDGAPVAHQGPSWPNFSASGSGGHSYGRGGYGGLLMRSAGGQGPGGGGCGGTFGGNKTKGGTGCAGGGGAQGIVIVCYPPRYDDSFYNYP